MPRSTPPTPAGEALPAAHPAQPVGHPNGSPEGQPTVFFTSSTGCDHLAASRDGARAHAIERLLTAEAAGERRELTTSDRMADRMERHAAGVAAAREAERQRLEAANA